jgi:hypothetical protein
MTIMEGKEFHRHRPINLKARRRFRLLNLEQLPVSNLANPE